MTLYRDPGRSEPMEGVEAGETLDADDLEGFALVTERRTVAIPAGPAVVRFEGVAGNILPESAIVAGLPTYVREKNLDADLLSPRTLYDRSLGRRVLIRRTDPATGRSREEQATIRSSAAGAGVVTLATGVESLRCSGLPEQVVYPEVPAGLSAKPTLSISTNSPRALTAAITLSYLAGGFDWQADYALTMRPDGRADLFAWVTLASGDVTSFPDAEVAAVAGRLNRDGEAGDDVRGRYARGGALRIRCWPSGADYSREPPPPPPPPPAPPPPPPPPAPMEMAMAQDVVVTGSRIARQEELGDLKLYRFPDRVTVASQSQKQVAMLDRRSVPLEVLYRNDLHGGDAGDLELIIRLRNRKADGLGLPLPAGPVAVFESANGRPMLLGTPTMTDKAVNEEVELELDAGPSVAVEVESLDDDRTPDHVDRNRLTVSNANPFPIRYEARIRIDEEQRLRAGRRLAIKDGRSVWFVTVPANGRATLDYQVIERK